MDAREAKYRLQVAMTLLGTGIIRPVRPDRLVRSLAALRRWGPTAAAAYVGGAIRQPQRTARSGRVGAAMPVPSSVRATRSRFRAAFRSTP